MGKLIDADKIIDRIYAKWGGDPAYYIDVHAASLVVEAEARRDACIVEMLRNAEEAITRCRDCWNLIDGTCQIRSIEISNEQNLDFYCADGRAWGKKG